MQILLLIVQLFKDLMDRMSRRLCYAVGNTDRSVFWSSIYSLIRWTWPGGDGVCTQVNSRRKALLFRDSNLQPDLSLDYKRNTLPNCAISAPYTPLNFMFLYLCIVPFGAVGTHSTGVFFISADHPKIIVLS